MADDREKNKINILFYAYVEGSSQIEYIVPSYRRWLMLKDISIPIVEIGVICKKWKIREFSFFGSVLTSHFSPISDIDILVEFEKDAEWSLLDLASLKEELKTLFGREIDLLEKTAIRNPFRQKEILSKHEVIYAA